MSKTDNKNCNGWISTSEALPPIKTRVLIVESENSRSYRREWCRSLDHTNCKALRTGAKWRMVLERTEHGLTSYPLATPATTPQRP